MKRIVVYTSKTGFTAKYAGWIAERLGCEAKALKDVDISSLEAYDQVIYGGWIMASTVTGYDKIKPLGLKNLIVFGVGMTMNSDSAARTVAEHNDVSADRFFYFEGGYNPKKAGLFGRMIIKMIVGSIRKKEKKTPEDIHMIETASGADRTNKAAIEPLIKFAINS